MLIQDVFYRGIQQRKKTISFEHVYYKLIISDKKVYLARKHFANFGILLTGEKTEIDLCSVCYNT